MFTTTESKLKAQNKIWKYFSTALAYLGTPSSKVRQGTKSESHFSCQGSPFRQFMFGVLDF